MPVSRIIMRVCHSLQIFFGEERDLFEHKMINVGLVALFRTIKHFSVQHHYTSLCFSSVNRLRYKLFIFIKVV